MRARSLSAIIGAQAFGIFRARPHKIEFEAVAVGPVERVEMLDAAAGLVVDNANELNQRRAGVQPERFGHIRGRETQR